MNDVLTQQEADQLVGQSWPDILAARARLDKLGERRAELAFLEESYQAGQRINLLLTSEQGLIGFAHRATGSCPLIDQVLSLCAGQLLAEERELLSRPAGPGSRPSPQRPAAGAKPAALTKAAVSSTTAPVGESGTEWLTAAQICEEVGIVYAYVSTWVKANGFLKKRNGKSMLYAAPPGFQYANPTTKVNQRSKTNP